MSGFRAQQRNRRIYIYIGLVISLLTLVVILCFKDALEDGTSIRRSGTEDRWLHKIQRDAEKHHPYRQVNRSRGDTVALTVMFTEFSTFFLSSSGVHRILS